MTDHVLTLNAGSSSIKFALFAASAPWPRLLAEGQVQGLGAEPTFEAAIIGGASAKHPMVGENHAVGVRHILEWLKDSSPRYRGQRGRSPSRAWRGRVRRADDRR